MLNKKNYLIGLVVFIAIVGIAMVSTSGDDTEAGINSAESEATTTKQTAEKKAVEQQPARPLKTGGGSNTITQNSKKPTKAKSTTTRPKGMYNRKVHRSR